MDRKIPDVGNPLYLAETTRRGFLKGATTAAAGFVVPKSLEAEPADALPIVSLGSHRVTRLIVGSNPIYGYSHFNRYLRIRDSLTAEEAVGRLLSRKRLKCGCFFSIVAGTILPIRPERVL